MIRLEARRASLGVVTIGARRPYMATTLNLSVLSLVSVAALAVSGCGPEPCEADLNERNESFDEGTDLGDFTDQETTRTFQLTLDTVGDTDVFFFNVRDEGADGNPEVDVWLEGHDGEQLEMVLEYQCTSDVMVDFECNAEEVSSERGRACRTAGTGELHLNLNYDCEGTVVDNTDSGFAVLTVTRNAPAQECVVYDLEVKTD
jgi:hypothetical protein